MARRLNIFADVRMRENRTLGRGGSSRELKRLNAKFDKEVVLWRQISNRK
jgi:hypothetical protein